MFLAGLKATAACNATLPVDRDMIRTEHMLRDIAPTVLATGFVRMIRVAKLAGDVHRFAAEMNASRFRHLGMRIVIFLERHVGVLASYGLGRETPPSTERELVPAHFSTGRLQ